MNRRGFFRTITGAAGALFGRKMLPPVVEEAAPEVGVSLRLVRRFDSVRQIPINRFDVFYGMSALRPEYAVRIVDEPEPERIQVRFDPKRLPL